MDERVARVTVGERLGRRNLWTYAAGGLGRDMSYSLWNSFLLVCIMYTKSVTTEQLAVIMVMMAVCRVWDAINDPIMGGIIERTRSRWGKFKPWIMIGVITNALITFMVFAVPLKGRDFVIFFPFAYLLWDITYTMNDIGYWAMMPSLTSNDRDRNALSTLANICAGIGAGLAGIMIPVFTTGNLAIGGSAVTGFTVMAGVIGLVFIGCQTMTCACVREKPLPPASERIGVREMFRVIFRNDQLLWVALVMILYNLGSSLYAASTTNFLYFRFGYDGAKVALFGTLGGILGAISVFYPALAKRFTRRQIAVSGILTAIVGYVLMFVIGSATVRSSDLGGIFAGLIVCSSLITMGQTMFYMVLTISVANTIEYNEWKTGGRDEGIIFSVRPFMAKTGSALVVLVQAVIYGILRVADFTNGISDLENRATNVMAQGSVSGADFGVLAEKAGLSVSEASALVERDGLAKAVGSIKLDGIENILKQVLPGTEIWMLFGLTVIPVLLVGAALLVWCKKYKIDEKFYAEMVAENLSRAGTPESAESAEAAESAESAESPEPAETIPEPETGEESGEAPDGVPS